MIKNRHKSSDFLPNPRNTGGKTQITQQMYNHYNSLFNVKPTIRQKKSNKKTTRRAKSRNVNLNPYSTEQIYQKAKRKEKEFSMLHNGISTDQWKVINSFSIIGQSNRKKQNFNTAIDHFFNLRSMYKKINQQKYRKPKNDKVLLFKSKIVKTRPSTSKIAHLVTIGNEAIIKPKQTTTTKKPKKKVKIVNKKEKKTMVKKKTKKIKNKIKKTENPPSLEYFEQPEEIDLKPYLPDENKDNENVPDLDMENGLTEEDMKESDVKDELEEKIPVIDKDASEEELLQFKEKIIELIFEYEIFTEDNFEKFFELCCLKSKNFEVEDMENVFEDIKFYLYEELKDDIDDE